MEKERCHKCGGKMVLVASTTLRCEKHRCETTRLFKKKIAKEELGSNHPIQQ